MRVSEAMRTPAVTCPPDATLRTVARLMEQRAVGSVVVVDEVGEVAGLVTDRDVAVRGVGEGLSADVHASVVMSRDVATIPPAADIVRAISIMRDRGVRRLPVVDEHGALHGMVALDDAMRVVGKEIDGLRDVIGQQR